MNTGEMKMNVIKSSCSIKISNITFRYNRQESEIKIIFIFNSDDTYVTLPTPQQAHLRFTNLKKNTVYENYSHM